MKEIFRWVTKENEIHEYRFTDGICDGFYSKFERKEFEEYFTEKYKGMKLTPELRGNLKQAGFLSTNPPSGLK